MRTNNQPPEFEVVLVKNCLNLFSIICALGSDTGVDSRTGPETSWISIGRTSRKCLGEGEPGDVIPTVNWLYLLLSKTRTS